MDSRLFADPRRSCLFIQIDFSALRAMKSCLVRSRLAVCLICAALCSCASVSLKKADVLTARAPTKTPEKIFVKPPEFYDAAVRVDRSGARLEAFKHEMQERFTRRLVRRLSRHVASAEAVAATAPLPSGNFWLIVSRFDRIDQGSRMLRSVVGFGAGGTKLETSVVVYDLSRRPPRPFLLLQTTGGSNAAPGAIGTAAYFATGVTALFSAGNLFEGTRSGLTFDTLRTVRQIVAALSEYLVDRGALSPDKRLRSKRLRGATQQTTARDEITVTPADPGKKSSLHVPILDLAGARERSGLTKAAPDRGETEAIDKTFRVACSGSDARRLWPGGQGRYYARSARAFHSASCESSPRVTDPGAS